MIEIFDVNGKTVYLSLLNIKSGISKTDFNISNLSNGAYQLIISNVEQILLTQKFIIIK